MKARYSRRALAQIAEIERMIAADSPLVASAFVRRMETLAALLARHPEIGRRTSLAEVRVVPARRYPYLVFYTTDATGGITVLRVRHMARREDWRGGR